MIRVNQSVKFLGVCPSSEDEILKHIENCGRHCYLSHDRMDDESYIKFYEMICKNGHASVLGHSNIVLNIEISDFEFINDLCYFYKLSFSDVFKFISMNFKESFGNLRTYFRFYTFDRNIIVSGNLRAWIEYINSSWESCFCYLDLCKAFAAFYPKIWLFSNKYLYKMNFNAGVVDKKSVLIPNLDRENIVKITLVDKEEQCRKYMYYDIPQFTFLVVTDRGISHEIVRHTTFTFSQESTRYINYNNRGFEFVIPEEMENIKGIDEYMDSCSSFYKNSGLPPQLARNFLPHALKTQFTMTGRKSAYDHFIQVRSSAAAHPSVRKITENIKEFFNWGGF